MMGRDSVPFGRRTSYASDDAVAHRGSNSHDETLSPAGIAWDHTRAQSRRLRFWIKQAIVSSNSRNSVTFRNHLDDEEEEQTLDGDDDDKSSTRSIPANRSQHAQKSEQDVVLDVPECRNMDEAMFSLYTLLSEPGRSPHDAQSTGVQNTNDNLTHALEVSSSLCDIPYDWILDGSAMQDDVKPSETKLEPRTIEEWIQYLQSQQSLGDSHEVSGQFTANFESSEARMSFEVVSSDNDDEDEFGEFHSAVEPESPEQVANGDNICGNDLAVELPSATTSDKRNSDRLNSEKKENENSKVPSSDDAESRSKHLDIEKHDVTDGSLVGSSVDRIANDAISKKSKADKQYSEEDQLSVMKILPLADVGSPEGRFARRQQVRLKTLHHEDGTDSSSRKAENDFPDHYYDEDADIAWEILRSIPWDEWDDEDRTEHIDEFFARELSSLDEEYNQITNMLIKRVAKHEPLLNEGNQSVHELDCQIAVTLRQVEIGKESLESARTFSSEEEKDEEKEEKNRHAKDVEEGLLSGLPLLRDVRERDDLRALSAVLDSCADLIDAERSLSHRLSSFGELCQTNATKAADEFQCLLSQANQIEVRVSDDPTIEKLSGLSELRKRCGQPLNKFSRAVQDALNVFLTQCCADYTSFDSQQYSMLFRCALDAHEFEMKHNKNKAVSPLAFNDIQNSWSGWISEALQYEATKCLARALLQPSEAQATSEYKKDLRLLSLELDSAKVGDRAKMLSLTHNLATIRFDFEAPKLHLHAVYNKTCMLLTEVLHMHYILTQWHRNPFDARNEEQSFLHSDVDRHDGDEQTTASSPPQSNNSPEKNSTFKLVSNALENTRVALWRHCESVLLTCFNHYSNHYSKNKKQRKWQDEVEEIEDLIHLTRQFTSLANGFLDVNQVETARVTRLGSVQTALVEKISDLCRKVLRSVHVDAMKSMGILLSKESWELLPVDVPSQESSYSSGNDQEAPIVSGEEVEKCVNLWMEELPSEQMERSSSLNKRFSRRNKLAANIESAEGFLRLFLESGNPFLCVQKKLNGDGEQEAKLHDVRADHHGTIYEAALTMERKAALYDLLGSFTVRDSKDKWVIQLGTASTLNGVVKWTRTMIYLTQKLPLIVDDIAKVIINIFDMYLLTVFRLCAGNSRNEKFLLGIQDRKNIPPLSGNPVNGRRGSTGSWGKKNRKAHGRKEPALVIPEISRSMDAEICAPILAEAAKVASVRNFVGRGHVELEGIVNLDKVEDWLKKAAASSGTTDDHDEIRCTSHTLEKKTAAAFSCVFIVAIVEATVASFKHRISTLSEAFPQTKNDTPPETNSSRQAGVESLSKYGKSAVEMGASMCEIGCRISCVHALGGREIVEKITTIGAGWSESALHEYANTYVEDACQRSALMWGFLCTSAHRMPSKALALTWGHLVGGGYLSLLEGFSNVAHCSLEGRSLMSMDLASFGDGVSSHAVSERLENSGLDAFVRVEGPPPVVCKRGTQYVETYIKVYYYPEEDVMEWIKENYMHYQQTQALALVVCGAGRDASSFKAKKLLLRVQNLYKSKLKGNGI